VVEVVARETRVLQEEGGVYRAAPDGTGAYPRVFSGQEGAQGERTLRLSAPRDDPPGDSR